MTQAQIDSKLYELKSFVSDKFKDIQMQSAALKNPEDQTKCNQIMTKIADDIADVRRAFGDITVLEVTEPEEEEVEENFGFPFKKTFA